MLGDWQKSFRRQVMSNIVIVTWAALCTKSKCSRRPWGWRRFTSGSLPVCMTIWWVDNISGGEDSEDVGSAQRSSMSEWKVILFNPTENVAMAKMQTKMNLPACVSRIPPKDRSWFWIRPRTHNIPRSPLALPCNKF